MVELARGQERVVSTEQLAMLGFNGAAVDLRLRRGQLPRLHRSVYAVGTPDVTFRGRLWAAILACGIDDSAISFWAAAAVWDLMSSVRKDIDVTTRGGSRSRDGIRVHRPRHAPEFVFQDDGLPVTTPSQVIVDLAPYQSRARLQQLCHRAEHGRLLDARALEHLLARNPRGAKNLRSILKDLARRGPQLARNDFEIAFLELLDRHGLPQPEVNAPLGSYVADFLWRDARLIVELDGAETHFTRAAFEADRQRDVTLQLRGWRVLRFTWRQLTRRPGYVAHAVRTALGSIAAIVALLAIGCGGGSSSTTQTGGTAASGEGAKSARQILADVSSTLSKVRTYHAEGTQTDKSGRSHLVVDVSATGDARFELDAGAQRTRMIVAGGETYINANRPFWTSQGGSSGPKVARLLADRWVKVPASVSGSLKSSLDKLQPKTLAYCLTRSSGSVTKAGTSTVDGRSVVVLADKGDRPGGSPGRLYVATSGPALPLRQMQTGPQRPGVSDRRCDDPTDTTTHSDVRLSAFDQPLKITAPKGALDLGHLAAGAGNTTQS